MTIINLTRRTIRVRTSASNDPSPQEGDREFPSQGLARVATRSSSAGDCEGVPVIMTHCGDVEGLPAPQDGVTYLVSFMVLQALSFRPDCLGLATGPNDGCVRDEKGHIYAVRAFQL